jgi:hypothetical protein
VEMGVVFQGSAQVRTGPQSWARAGIETSLDLGVRLLGGE